MKTNELPEEDVTAAKPVHFYAIEPGKYNLEIEDEHWNGISYCKAKGIAKRYGITLHADGSCRCSRCKVYKDCGWSAYRADSNFPAKQLIYGKCQHYCEKAKYTAKTVDIDGLVRVFEAAAAQERRERGLD